MSAEPIFDVAPITACGNAIQHFQQLATEAEHEAERLTRAAEAKAHEGRLCREQVDVWNRARLALEAVAE